MTLIHMMKCCNNTLLMIKFYCVLSCRKLCELWYIICADVDFPLGVMGTADHSTICMNWIPSCSWLHRGTCCHPIYTIMKPTNELLYTLHTFHTPSSHPPQSTPSSPPHTLHTLRSTCSLYTPNTLLTLCTHHLHTADSIL